MRKSDQVQPPPSHLLIHIEKPKHAPCPLTRQDASKLPRAYPAPQQPDISHSSSICELSESEFMFIRNAFIKSHTPGCGKE